MGIDTTFYGSLWIDVDSLSEEKCQEMLDLFNNWETIRERFPSLTDKLDWDICNDDLQPVINHRGCAYHWIPWLRALARILRDDYGLTMSGSLNFMTAWGDYSNGVFAIDEARNKIVIVNVRHLANPLAIDRTEFDLFPDDVMEGIED